MPLHGQKQNFGKKEQNNLILSKLVWKFTSKNLKCLTCV